MHVLIVKLAGQLVSLAALQRDVIVVKPLLFTMLLSPVEPLRLKIPLASLHLQA